jgi:cytochrome c biogenesis protein CcdA
MIQEITQKLEMVASEPIGLLFALLLGAASAVASTCCTLPALGLVAGYSGTKVEGSKREIVKSALLFMVGTIVSLMIIGAVSGFVGQVAQSMLGSYWKIFAGVIAIILGLASLKLLPFNLSLGNFALGNFDLAKLKQSRLGSVLTGIVLGGVVAACSLPCNPGIFIVMGAAILQGAVLWATLLLGMYAIGFALPLGLLMLGISLGSVTLASKGLDKILRWISGAVLIVVGLYFLLSF